MDFVWELVWTLGLGAVVILVKVISGILRGRSFQEIAEDVTGDNETTDKELDELNEWTYYRQGMPPETQTAGSVPRSTPADLENQADWRPPEPT